MSEGVALGIGLVIGLLIIVAVLVIKRDELAQNARRRQGGVPDEDLVSLGETGRSRGATAFGSFSGAITVLVGVLLGEWLLLLAGVVLLLGVGIQVIMSRRSGHGSGNRR